mgnify:CR=1 FL=1
MKIVYSDRHSAHDPQTFFVRGTRQRSSEQPERATRLLSAATAAGHQIVAPTSYGVAPAATVHTPEYLDFLQIAAREWAKLPGASAEVIPNVHPARYPATYPKGLPGRAGWHQADLACPIGPHTWEAALAATECAATAADAVLGGMREIYALCRPPGHHAYADMAGGFCFLNNTAIAAQRLRGKYQRVAILDVDVHHGNGSQDIFWADKSVMYASTHQMPLFPGTGAASERGEHDTIVNVPLHAGDDGDTFREAFAHGVLPRLEAFRPDLIVISAGFDAHWRDPLANLKLTEADFAWATREVMGIADRRCGGRVVSLLEGGYDLIGLSKSVAAHVETLMGR